MFDSSRTKAARRAAIAFVWSLSMLAAASPLTALAASGNFATQPQNVPAVSADSQLQPGDWISVGFSIQNHNGKTRAVTFSLANAAAYIGLSCAKNGQIKGAISASLPAGPYTIPANTGGWWPSDHQNDASTYQSAFQFTSRMSPCSGGSAFLAGGGAKDEVYAGTLQASDTSDQFHLQFHTAIPAAANRGNANCTKPQPESDSKRKACDFGWNGSVDNVTPAAYQQSSPPPSPGPSSSPPSQSGGGAGSSGSSPPPPTAAPGGSTGSGSQPAANGGSASNGGSQPADGGVNAGNTSGAIQTIGPDTMLGAHGFRTARGGVLGIVSRGGATITRGATPGAVTSAAGPLQPVSVNTAPPASTPALMPIPVIAPVGAAAGSLIARLPVQWYALLAAVDCALVLAILGRRNRVGIAGVHTRNNR